MKSGHSAATVVALCFLVAVLEGYDIQAFGVAARQIVQDLGLDASRQGTAASMAMLGLVLGAVFGGRIADRIGRKPVLVVSVAAFGAFTIWTAMANDYASLLAARFVTGVGLGGALPNLMAMSAEISRPGRRGITTTMMFCGLPAGGAAVALLARAAPDLDWRQLFIIGGVLPLLVAPLLVWLLPETRVQRSEPQQPTMQVLFGEGRTASTLLIWTVFVLTLLVLYLILNWLPSLVVDKGLTPGDGATAALAFNLTSVAGALLMGLVVDRFGFRWPIAVSYVALAAATFVLAGARELPLVLLASAAAGFFILGAQYSLYAYTPILYPPASRGLGSGAAVGVGRVGSIVGPLLAGELRATGLSADAVIGLMAPVALAAGGAVLVLSFLGRIQDGD